MTYVTFYSHFGAMQFKRKLEARGTAVTLMPVPRFLSSSCGTCARLDDADAFELPMEDVEGVYPQR